MEISHGCFSLENLSWFSVSLRNPNTSGISIICLDFALSPRNLRIGGFGKRSLCYEPGINRRNKLCRWVEVSGKIEFADCLSESSRRGGESWRKGEGQRGDLIRVHDLVRRRFLLSLTFIPFLFFRSPFPSQVSCRCLLCLSRRQLFDPASETYPLNLPLS